MARKVGVSGNLIDIVERGGVTHPEIAKKIGKAYYLSELETEELMPEHHRKHSPNYDPGKYRSLYDIKMGDVPVVLEQGEREVMKI